jgi:hypothetical protein
MARCLIVACGCRGLELAGELRERGHVVRATSRRAGQLETIAAAGAEPHEGDPDRVGTIFPALAHVAIAYLLLGSATGAPAALEALHGPRLEALLGKMLDSTVRGVVYEIAGSVDSGLLATGAELVRSVCGPSRIPYLLLDVDPTQRHAWLQAAAAAPARLLTARDRSGV